MEAIRSINKNTFEENANRARNIFVEALNPELGGKPNIKMLVAGERLLTEYDNMLYLLKLEIEKNRKLMNK